MQIQKITQDFFQRTRSKKAFTLVELLMVMVVIMILIGIGLPVAKYVSERIVKEREFLMRTEMVNALEAYRLAFGEYPIPGSDRHYPRNFDNDPDKLLPEAYRGLDLVENPLESFDFSGHTIDYSLVWPLMLGPMSRGEDPFLIFPEVVVTYLLYDLSDIDKRVTTQERRTLDGGMKEGREISGVPIRRYLAISPETGIPYEYKCSDGFKYEIK